MLASFFKKSEPICFIAIFLITLLAFFISKTDGNIAAFTVGFIVKQIAYLFIIYATIFLLNFIVIKNSLTKKSNFEMLFFSFFLLMITQSISQPNVILSNFFVLLGFRRIMSLSTQKNREKKLFDAAFWITIASLFYFWAILFVALIAAALIINKSSLKNWIIPFFGFFTVIILCVTGSIIFYDSFLELLNTAIERSYDFSVYNSIEYIIAITLLVSFGVWSSFLYLNTIKKKKKSIRGSFKIIVLAEIIAFLIILQAPVKNGSEFLFLFAPLAIITTSYIQTIKDKWVKDIFFGILIGVPFFLLMI